MIVWQAKTAQVAGRSQGKSGSLIFGTFLLKWEICRQWHLSPPDVPPNHPAPMKRVRVAADRWNFELENTGEYITPLGGNILDDYHLSLIHI